MEQFLTDGQCDKVVQSIGVLLLRFVMGKKPVRTAMSSFLIKSHHRILMICRWYLMCKASSALVSDASSV